MTFGLFILRAMAVNIYEVVGGVSSGGILVRTDVDLKSAPAISRLATGSVVQEIAQEGGRLLYKKLTGTGPDYGWVTVVASDKPLLVLAREDEALRALSHAANVVRGAVDGKGPSEWNSYEPPPTRGKFVPKATGRAKLEPWVPQDSGLPPNLRQCTPWKKQLKGKNMKAFMEAYMHYITTEGISNAPTGYFHGLPIPHTLDMIREFGVEWLTMALHAAGTLPHDNEVVNMDVQPATGGTACKKARISVIYKNPDAALHSTFFVKFPFTVLPNEADLSKAYQVYCLWNVFGPEIDFARILSARAPMRCAKYYFGDVNMECGIFILITECLDLPEEHLDYGPLELEPIPRKAIEYCFDDPFAYYASMTRNAARLGAWCWNGKFGDDILQIFPAPELPAMFNVGTRSRIQTYLHFVTQEIAHLLPPDIIDEQFASTLVETLVEVEKAQRDIFKHLYAETKMIGLIHANMQADNAIFWRSDDGSMQSGFIDWGKVKQDTYGWELACGFYAINPPELLSAIDKMLLRIFIDELKAQGGPDISWDVMFEHYRLSWCLLAIDIIAAPEALWSSCEQAKPGAWSTIQSVQDPRVWHMPDVARGNLATIRNLAHIWKRLDLPTFFAEWRCAHPGTSKERKQR